MHYKPNSTQTYAISTHSMRTHLSHSGGHGALVANVTVEHDEAGLLLSHGGDVQVLHTALHHGRRGARGQQPGGAEDYSADKGESVVSE